MYVICVDDERPALNNLLMKLRELSVAAEGFTDCDQALASLRERPADAVFLDIDMPGTGGMALARRIKEIDGDVRVVFVTGYSEYAVEAFRMHAAGYLMKPVALEDLRAELANLRKTPPRERAPQIRVRCFGNFEVYWEERPLTFARSKAKELFAYLVYRKGSACTIRELAGILFEDDPYSAAQLNYLHKIISAMRRAFDAYPQADQLFRKSYNELSVNPDCLSCDYYDFLSWDMDAINEYAGEFMTQYSWAEFMCGYLDQKLSEDRPPAR